VKRISLTSEQDWEVNDKPTEVATVVNVVQQLSASALQPTVLENDNNEETKITPSNVWEGLESRAPAHRLLDSIPTSDLGESLDCRGRKTEEEVEKNKSRSAPVSANSLDSGDSGYDEYEDEYAHIITENSPKGLVEQVVEDFKPAELPELLVITGRACTRILSGYQKSKKEEETILANLREEGLLAKPGGKGQGGISFEIVDIATAGEDLSVGVVAPQAAIPECKLSRLEQRRVEVNEKRGDGAELADKLALADQRRREMEADRIRRLTEVSGHERIVRAREEQIVREQSKQQQAMNSRKTQLESMRSKLKEKTKKVEMLKLKKSLALDASHSSYVDFGESTNSFFDD